MGQLSAETITKLQPIANVIDAELEKEQNDRAQITIKSTVPRNLKRVLAKYKSDFRRDWNGLFFMNVKEKEGQVVIDFQPKVKPSFAIEVKPKKEKEDKSLLFESISSIPLYPADGVPREDDDIALMKFFLIEGLQVVQNRISAMLPATQAYLVDSNMADEPALMKFLERQGWKWTVLNNNRLRIHQ